MNFKSLILGLALIVAGNFSAAAQDITWRVPTSVPEGSFFYKNFLERFAKNASIITDGKVKIQPFGAGVIVPAFEVYKSVQEGIVEAGHSTPSYLVNQDPTNAIFASFPGGMSAEATLTWLYDGGGAKKLTEFRRDKMGLHSLVVGVGTSEVLAHSNKPLKTLKDFANLKYRTSGAWAAVLKEDLKGVPTVVPGGEIYTLLQRKGVDAIEWATPGSNITEGFHEVAPYMVFPGVHQPSFVWEIVVKKEKWDALPDDLKKKLELAARLSTYESFTYFLDADMKAMGEYAKTKVELLTLPPDVVKALREAGRNWARKKAKALADGGDKRMQSILDDYFAYQAQWAKGSKYLVRDTE
ncbi:MAG: TRAP transporter substrate-binding protein DctP [Hyphomicrobiaceae bacterium]|nr:TRAP transporter substrate-binding protein DctP [Hyphomicrobiaceae bacterium]